MSPRPEQTRAIHALKRQSGITDPEYRAHLEGRFKVASSKELSEAQAASLLDDLRQASGQPRPAARSSRASGKFAPVLRALWLAAWNLGIVENPDDAALLAFVKRQCKVDHDRFLVDGDAARPAIEALKSWMTREASVRWARAADLRPGESLASANKRRVIAAIARRIREAGLDGFDTERFAAISGLESEARSNDHQLDKLAARMGGVLRSRLADAARRTA